MSGTPIYPSGKDINVVMHDLLALLMVVKIIYGLSTVMKSTHTYVLYTLITVSLQFFSSNSFVYPFAPTRAAPGPHSDRDQSEFCRQQSS